MASDSFTEELFCSCLDAADFGQALEAACTAHPALAAELRHRHAALCAAGLAEPAAPDLPAQERIGAFRLSRLLGSGGMGLVYAAVEEATGREVALKLIRPEQAWLPGRRERFRREAAALQRLDHPGIVKIHAIGEHRDVPFLAMEMVPGRTLAEVIEAMHGQDPAALQGADLLTLLARPGAATAVPAATPTAAPFAGSWVAAAVHIAHGLAEALAHAHAQGILHRDIKPSNVVLTPAGRVVLIDFGLARDADATAITRTGGNPGSLPYMAPEILTGHAQVSDPRADVYAVGVLLYELLTLRLPFDDASADGLRASILAGDFTSVRRRNRAVPRDVEAICQTAMAPDPARRYLASGALAADLGNVLAMRPVAARSMSRLQWLLRRTRRRPFLAATLLGAMLTLPILGGATVYWAIHAGELAAGSTALRQERYEELVTAGYLHLEQNDYRKALASFTAADELLTGDCLAAAGKMMVHLTMGEKAAALAIAEQADRETRRALWPLEVQALERLGRFDEASRLAATQPSQSEPAELFLRGRTMLHANEKVGDPAAFAAAADLISRALSLSPRPRLPFWCERVHAAGHTNDLRVLREGSEALERQWPQSVLSWFWIGYARQRFDPAGAIVAYRRALALAPSFLHARNNLAQLLAQQGQVEAARAEADRMLAIAPEDVESWLQTGYTSDLVGDHARSQEAYQRAVAIAPNNELAVLNLGVHERRVGNLDEAERLFARAIELAPKLAGAHACLASMLGVKGRYDEAITMARTAIAADPDLAYAHRVLAWSLAHKGEGDAARAALQRALLLDPRGEYTHKGALEVLEILGDRDGLAAEDERFLRLQKGTGR